jgi:hypothetical protein
MPALLDTWPEPIQKAFHAGNQLVSSMDSFHFSLAAFTPPNRPIIFFDVIYEAGVLKHLSELQRKLVQETKVSIEAVEAVLMAAHGTQPMIWHGREFNCAHRAVMNLAGEMVGEALTAMQLVGGVFLPILPKGRDKASWQDVYVEVGRFCQILKENEAGPQWKNFCDHYLAENVARTWTPTAGDELATRMRLEANQAARLWKPSGEPKSGDGDGEIRKIRKTGPRNLSELVRFDEALRKGYKQGRDLKEIALEKTNGDEKKAETLLRKHRYWVRKGILNPID